MTIIPTTDRKGNLSLKKISSLLNFKPFLQFVTRRSKNWKIAKKIGYGYAVAIGIAVFGGAIGLVVGDYYQRKAEEQLHLAEQQLEYLYTVETLLVNIRFHPQQIVMVLQNPVWFEYERREFLNQTAHFRQVLEELTQFVEEHPNHTAIPIRRILALQDHYLRLINDYEGIMEDLWERLKPVQFTPENVSLARQQIMEVIAGQNSLDMRIQFERLSEDLLQINGAAQKQKEAAIAGRINADRLRIQIILSSLVIAVGIATLLALRTSRAIAYPLEVVTNVARNVTKNSDFNLRAPVTTQDEIGILADSLNQLVEWVGDYTQQLEHSQETLEQRVAERTQELQHTLQDLQQTQAQLIQTEKMSSLGQMVAGVAHEINNPVNFIHGNIIHIDRYLQDLFELLKLYEQSSLQPSPEVVELVEDMDLDFMRSDVPHILKSMQMGSDRIKEIVLSLRNFSRLDEAEMKRANLHEGIDNTLIILSHRLKEGVEVVKNYGDIPLVFCYPAQLNQVFMNLISNALDAMNEAEIESKKLTISTQKISGDRLLIAIGDNGLGIPDTIKDKLFDPFFTTKPIGKGTGLGLSICYQIIEKHNGVISVNSQPGEGTEFAIVLPISDS